MTETSNGGVPLHARLAFGFTAVIESTKFQIYEVFLIFYYAQVLGLAGSLAGLAIAISIFTDAALDPLIGSYSDSFRGRLGRRHTLMYAALLPVAVCVFMLFSVPSGLSQLGLFAWLLIFSLSVRLVGSFYAVPAAAIAAELTTSAELRAELGIWRQAIVAGVGALLTWAIFAYALVPTPEIPRGQENPANYPRFALLVASVILVCAAIGAWGTQRPVQQRERELAEVKPRKFDIVESLRAAWRAIAELRNFRAMFLGLLFAGVMGSYFRALNLHIGTFFWQLSTRQTGTWLLAVQVATFAAALTSRFAIRRVEPKILYMTGVALMLGGYVLPPGLRLLGLMPENGTDALLWSLYAANVGVGVGTGLIMVCSAVMFAETADEYAYEKRESRTGMLLAFLPLGNKMASSIGKILAGIIVQWIALPVGQPARTVAVDTMTDLGLAAVALTLVAGCIALACYSRYHLPRARYAQIADALRTQPRN